MRGATDNASESHFTSDNSSTSSSSVSRTYMGIRTYGQMGSADPPPGKWIKKLKSENMQKQQKWCILQYI